MSDLIVKPVQTQAERSLFLEYPWQVYRGDPYWIPPLRGNQRELVGYAEHPFYLRNVAQTFLALRGGQVCGRIAAIINHGHNLRFGERRGFYGFFECVDDQQVANGLFDIARQWLADQGIYRVRGPVNPSLNYELGLLVDGFDSSPMFMMTYNPPYYQKLVENYGFVKSQDLFAFWGNVEMLPTLGAKLQPIAEQIIERYDVKLRPLDTARFMEDVIEFLSIYNLALTNTWGFVPMTDAEMAHTAKGLKHLMVPELAIGAIVDGRMVGATFALPDYNPRIRAIDGRLFPFGFIHLLARKHLLKRVRVISTNVLPEYQRMGIGLVLMHGLVPKALDWKLEEAEFSWVLESNSLSRGALKKGGAQIVKTYRLYDFDDDPPASADGSPAPCRRSIVPAASPPKGKLEVREVTSKADQKRFIELPWSIYADDPQWVPPLRRDVAEFVDRRRHPFYRHGEAAQFIALRDGQTVGRILVSDDPNYNRQHGENLGCFGMFESTDDRKVAAGLLNAAAAWLRARGRDVMRGPVDYSMNYACGLLVDGFEWPPRAMMNHNPVYYAALLESCGLKKAKDLFAYWFDDPRDMAAKIGPRAERIAQRTNVVVRSFERSQFAEDVARCQQVYNDSMGELWGFVKLTDAEFRYLSKQLAQMALANQVLLAEVDGKPVGFSVTIPDVNEAIRPLNGRLTRWGMPVNAMRLLWRLKRVTTARMAVLSVNKEYHRRGVAALLILRTLEHGKQKLGYTGAELSWTVEDNVAVNRTIEAVGAKRYKTYRVYERAI
jgi:GNAT superfamily N-acetyltransferase